MDTPRQTVTGSGISLEYQGRLLYSRTEPARRPVRIARSAHLKPDTLYLIPSPLLLYGLPELAARLPHGSLLLCIEKDPELAALTEETWRNAGMDPSKAGFISAPSLRDFPLRIKELSRWPFRRVEQLVLTGGYALHRNYYDGLLRAADEAIRIAYQDKLTLVYFARRWMKNLFTNLLSRDRFYSYRELSTDKPVVVAGAGKSLESLMPEIRRARAGVFLLAVDTALPALCSAGLVPDAVVVLEAQFINIRDFYGIPTDRIDLIADISSYPSVLRLPWKNRYLFFTRFAPLRFFDTLLAPLVRELSLPPYGSVGVAAVGIGAAMTAKGVYCAGLDFSYRLGKSHCRGTQFIASQLAESLRTVPAGSYAPFMQRPLLRTRGKKSTVLTDLILLNYLTPLKSLTAENPSVFDLNSEGLDIGAGYRPRIEETDTQDGSPGQTPPGPVPEKKDFSAWRAVLREELEILDRIYEAGLNFLTSGVCDGNLVRLIADHDYLTAHFPEHIREIPCEPEFIKRVLLSIEGYRSHLVQRLSNP